MTFEAQVLRALRALGPCSARDIELAARCWPGSHPENSVDQALYRLRRKHLVRLIEGETYDVTKRARSLIDREDDLPLLTLKTKEASSGKTD